MKQQKYRHSSNTRITLKIAYANAETWYQTLKYVLLLMLPTNQQSELRRKAFEEEE